MKTRNPMSLCALIAVCALLGACQGRSDDAEAVASAKNYIDKQDYKAAIIRAKNALQSNPQNGEARRLLGQALLETGSAQAAAVELRKALEFNAGESKTVPLLARALLAQGETSQLIQQFASTRLDDAAASADLKTSVATAYASQGERDNALETVLSALKEWPQHAPATLLHARIKAADGDTAGALALIEPVLARDAKDVNALILKADLQRLGQQDRDAALATYRSAVAASPGAVAAHSAIIAMLLEQRDVAGAKTQLERLKAAQPGHPETRRIEAQLAYLGNDFAKTREITEQLLKHFPNDPRILQLAGAAELRLNSLAQAEVHLGQAMRAAPRALLPRQMLAQIHLRTGQPQKVLDVLQPILESTAPDAESLTLAGQAHLQSGDLARSEAAFARAAKIDPKATTARTALALNQLAKGNAAGGYAELEAVAAGDTGTRADMALIAARLRANDLGGALKAVDALEKKQPGKPLAQVLRANIELRRKNTVAAKANFEKALAIDALYFPATAGLAALEMAAGRPEGAKKRFEDLLRADPKNYRAMLGLAEVKARMGSPKEEVTQAIANAAKASPTEPAPRMLLVKYLLSQQDTKAALAAAQDATAALPNNLEVLDQLGAAQLAAGQAQQAVSTYTKLAAARPDRPEPELRLAHAHVAAKDLEAARRSLERALKIKPGLLSAQRALAEVEVLQKRYPQALEIARTLQRAQPKQAVGHVLEADIESARGRHDAAAAALRLALPLGGGTEVAIRLHRALGAAGRKDEAERLISTWKKEHPQDTVFRFYLGDTALAHKDFAAAEAHYRSVTELQPDNALALNNIAWLMTRQQKPGAVAVAERANQLLPGRPALMDTLAWAMAAENQAPQAIELQKKAIAKAPDDASLKLTLAKIYLKAGDRPRARAELESLAKLGDKFPGQSEVVELLKSP
ncbi:MAG: PEP-CTERM system TPR-repeat protein PrsT [Rubrivivax sp.]|nr:PEP-CTERM system TPR-repeat protein PrsT [Rubrivivax sp.]